MSYAPNEFKDDDGTIVGFAVDLVDALGDVLGVTMIFNEGRTSTGSSWPAVRHVRHGILVVHRHRGT